MNLTAIEHRAAQPLYVSLGDSYSSGMGSETTPLANGVNSVDRNVFGTSGDAWRSSRSAAQMVARDTGYDLRDVSYAGATADTVLRTGQGTEPPQITAVTTDTKLVTLTIGGNDSHMINLSIAVHNTDVTPSSPIVAQVAEATAGLQAKVSAVLAHITQRAPNAQVRIAGYPYLYARPGQDAGTAAGYLTETEKAIMQQAQDGVNAAIRGAAELAGPNVRYVDPDGPTSPFDGTDDGGLLSMGSRSPNRWINGETDLHTGAFAVHPNIRGTEHYAKLYEASL